MDDSWRGRTRQKISSQYLAQNWKRCSHSKNNQMFLSTLSRIIWKRNNHRSFSICFWRKLGQRNHTNIATSDRFRKAQSVFKMLSLHTKQRAGFFKFLRFEERFQRALFSTQINVDGRPNRRDKAVFTNACTMKPQAVENIIQSIAWQRMQKQIY